MASNPVPGDFCVVPISGPVGKLISIGEWLNGQGFNDYDHAEIYLGMANENAPNGYTFGAYPGGATLVAMPEPSQQQGWLWSTDHITLTTNERDQVVANCANLEGTPYSALDYFALAAHRFHLPIPWLKSYIASTKHMICSQLVDYVYMISGVHLFQDGRWPGYVTPADLAMRILGQEHNAG